jgi:hypothetical protein
LKVLGKCGNFEVTIDDNFIEIKYNAVKHCSKILFVQSVKSTINGRIKKASEIFSEWAFKDRDTICDGTRIDHLFCEKDPFYNGDDPLDQGQGEKSNTKSISAQMSDEPFYPDDCIETTNGNTSTVKLYFETCVCCADNPTNFLDCMRWEYHRTRGEENRGIIYPYDKETCQQSDSMTEAFNLFKKNHTDTNGNPFCPDKKLEK